MKSSYLLTYVILAFMVLSTLGQGFGRRRSVKRVSSPNIDFTCGRRSSLSIRFRPGPSRPRPGAVVAFRRRRSIVGGVQSVANSWPWMVLLGRKRGPRIQYFCSAVLINKQFALTAAHCMLDPAPFFARLGEHDHSILFAEKIAPHEDVNVEDVFIHPSYSIRKGYNDVAILKLSTPVRFRNEVKPVCLPWGKLGTENLVGETVTIAGWGSEQFGSEGSPVLREVSVSVLKPSRCQTSYSTLPEFKTAFPRGMTRDNIVCAGNILGGKDSCQGDSGGPIVHRGSGGVYSLAGIISKGYGCGKQDFPGLYAPIRNYETLQWIKKTAF